MGNRLQFLIVCEDKLPRPFYLNKADVSMQQLDWFVINRLGLEDDEDKDYQLAYYDKDMTLKAMNTDADVRRMLWFAKGRKEGKSRNNPIAFWCDIIYK